MNTKKIKISKGVNFKLIFMRETMIVVRKIE